MRKFAGNRNEKDKSKNEKPIFLGMSILDISKALMYKFWYDYIKPNYGDRANLCYIHVKTEDFMKTLLMMLKNGLIHLTMIRMMIVVFQ